MSDKKKACSVRLEEKLIKWLSKCAEKNGRDFTKELRFRITQLYNEDMKNAKLDNK